MNSKFSKLVFLVCSIGLISVTSSTYAKHGGHHGGHHRGGHHGGHHGGHYHGHHHGGHWNSKGYWRHGVWVTTGVGCKWKPGHYNRKGFWIPGHCL